MAARLDFELRPLRYLGAAMLALGAALPHLPGDVGLPCPLRTTTGVPCPFCGLTTSVKAALRADPHGAWAANPFGLILVALAAVVVVRPRWRVLSLPAAVVAAGVAMSWLFELHRYHFF
jgi:hypothetical protein